MCKFNLFKREWNFSVSESTVEARRFCFSHQELKTIQQNTPKPNPVENRSPFDTKTNNISRWFASVFYTDVDCNLKQALALIRRTQPVRLQTFWFSL